MFKTTHINLLNPFKFAEDFFGDSFKEFEEFNLKSCLPSETNFPKYNLINTSTDNKVFATIEIALAGWKKEDLSIKLENCQLFVIGKKSEVEEEKKYYVKGITSRNFNWSIRVSDYTELESAKFENGILTIIITQNIPEEKLPKTIEIS